MTPTLRLLSLPVLAALLLTTEPCRAQYPDAMQAGLHTVSLNLAPAVNREVHLSYERALFFASSLEVTVGVRVPSAEDQVVRSVNLLRPGGYGKRVSALPYEKSVVAGMHWKKFFSHDRGLLTFLSPGVLYRHGFFDDKSYTEQYPLHLPYFGESSFTDQFSLRKHEATARILFGVRRHFYLGDGQSAFIAEAAWGVGVGTRFGRLLDYRRQTGPGPFAPFTPWTGRPADSPTVHFNVGVITLPVSLKIGYSWGG